MDGFNHAASVSDDSARGDATARFSFRTLRRRSPIRWSFQKAQAPTSALSGRTAGAAGCRLRRVSGP
jgi:hypothetical protein